MQGPWPDVLESYRQFDELEEAVVAQGWLTTPEMDIPLLVFRALAVCRAGSVGVEDRGGRGYSWSQPPSNDLRNPFLDLLRNGRGLRHPLH